MQLKSAQSSRTIPQSASTYSQTERGKLDTVLILGRGRSGTTWIAQMMNTYADCCYKHEPFLRTKSTDYNTWLQEIESGDIDRLRSRYEEICRRVDRNVDMPPFPPKSFRTQNGKLLHLLYGMGHRIKLAKSLYEWYAKTPLTEQTPVLIKDVNFPNKRLPRLCEVIEPSVLAVIRNPFANIASYLKGVELSLFENCQQAKVESVRQILQTPEGQPFSQYLDRLDDLSLAQIEALLWRMNTEPLVEFARSYDRGLVVVYEDVCLDPHAQIAKIFDFVGWEVGQSTRDFIDLSISGEKSAVRSDRAYYSVYRDPRQSMSKWKTQLTDEQVADIASVIRESPLTDLWSDLPL